jgi:F-type H+-transporting ATPase subunit epsilon
MKIDILSQNKKIFQGQSKSIILPGEKGQFQILDNHANLFALLSKGEIIIDEVKKFPIFSGIVEVFKNHVIILVKEL